MEILLALSKAFVVGGVICVIAQLFIELTPYSVTPAHILVGYVVGGALISVFGLYQPIVNFAGAGATIPLSGFGHLLMQGTIDAIAEEGFKGIFTGGLAAASFGITIAMLMGAMMAVIFQPRG